MAIIVTTRSVLVQDRHYGIDRRCQWPPNLASVHPSVSRDGTYRCAFVQTYQQNVNCWGKIRLPTPGPARPNAHQSSKAVGPSKSTGKPCSHKTSHTQPPNNLPTVLLLNSVDPPAYLSFPLSIINTRRPSSTRRTSNNTILSYAKDDRGSEPRVAFRWFSSTERVQMVLVSSSTST